MDHCGPPAWDVGDSRQGHHWMRGKQFRFQSMLAARKHRACGRRWQKMATQVWANVEEEWMKAILMEVKKSVHQKCSFMWTDNFWIMSHSKEQLGHMLRDFIDEAVRVVLDPKPASLWWTSKFASEEKEDLILSTSKRSLQFSIWIRFQDTGMCDESSRENLRRCGRKNAVSWQSFVEGHHEIQK